MQRVEVPRQAVEQRLLGGRRLLDGERRRRVARALDRRGLLRRGIAAEATLAAEEDRRRRLGHQRALGVLGARIDEHLRQALHVVDAADRRGGAELAGSARAGHGRRRARRRGRSSPGSRRGSPGDRASAGTWRRRRSSAGRAGPALRRGSRARRASRRRRARRARCPSRCTSQTEVALGLPTSGEIEGHGARRIPSMATLRRDALRRRHRRGSLRALGGRPRRRSAWPGRG